MIRIWLAATLIAAAAITAQANVKFGGSKVGGMDSKVPGVIPTPTVPAGSFVLLNTASGKITLDAGGSTLCNAC